MNGELLHPGDIGWRETGEVYSLSFANNDDLPHILKLISTHDSDARGLAITSDVSYTTGGRAKLVQSWETDLLALSQRVPLDIFLQIDRQSQGVRSSQYITQSPVEISDPFGMSAVEESCALTVLQHAQLRNCIVARSQNGEIIGLGRVLDICGHVEMVSLVVDEQFRACGVGSALIRERLARSTRWPMYSFVHVSSESRPGSSLIAYYMHQYARYNPVIPLFDMLPEKLQKDLARMNDFWGPYTVIQINGK